MVEVGGGQVERYLTTHDARRVIHATDDAHARRYMNAVVEQVQIFHSEMMAGCEKDEDFNTADPVQTLVWERKKSSKELFGELIAEMETQEAADPEGAGAEEPPPSRAALIERIRREIEKVRARQHHNHMQTTLYDV
jgi:protein-tyrosine-phosphatase